MWNQLKKVIAMNKGDFILILSLTAGIFLVLQFVIAVVMVVLKPGEGVRISGPSMVFASTILMLVLTLAALLVNYPQALQFGCTRRRGLLLQAGLLGAQYLATVPLVAAALLFELHLAPTLWKTMTGRSEDLEFFLDGLTLPWWLVLAAPLGGIALGLIVSAVIHRFGRVGGWTLYGVWMVFMLGQSFLPWKEHWWTAPWLYPAVWVLALAALAWSVRTLLRVTIKA